MSPASIPRIGSVNTRIVLPRKSPLRVNSTTLFEFLTLNVPFYRFRVDSDTDKFRDLKIPMFSSCTELEELVQIGWKNLKEIYDKEIGSEKNVKTQYKKFLLENSL